MTEYIQGKEVIDSPGYTSLPDLDAGNLLDVDTTHTQGTVVSITNTPASAGDPDILQVNAAGTSWSAGSCVECVTEDIRTTPVIINQATNTSEHISLGVSGTTYCTIGIGSSDQLLLQTTNNDTIQLLPTGTGITVTGSGTTSKGLSKNDDKYITGKLEVDGNFYMDGTNYFLPGSFSRAGLSNDFVYLGGIPYTLLGTAGFGYIQAGDNLAWMRFSWDSALTLTKTAGSANTVVTNADGNVCVYKSGNNINMQNKLGTQQKMSWVYYVWVP